jgi:NAD(P)-dependent dehydrogenase (short-subunit alcohol dehydrogenase family)
MPRGTIIVTGASRGIGAAIAQNLSARGFFIAALSRTGATSVGQGYSCDVCDEISLKETISVIGQAGPVVGLVNNAGIHRADPSAELTVKQLEETFRPNFFAVMLTCREVYPFLKDAGGGAIVNIGSFFDKLGVPENVAYCASKAAVGALTRCLAVEWAADKVRVLNIAPGYIETDLNREFMSREKVKAWLARRIPIGRSGTPQEVASLVGAIFAENMGFLTGETIYLDGGQAIKH